MVTRPVLMGLSSSSYVVHDVYLLLVVERLVVLLPDVTHDVVHVPVVLQLVVHEVCVVLLVDRLVVTEPEVVHEVVQVVFLLVLHDVVQVVCLLTFVVHVVVAE